MRAKRLWKKVMAGTMIAAMLTVYVGGSVAAEELAQEDAAAEEMVIEPVDEELNEEEAQGEQEAEIQPETDENTDTAAPETTLDDMGMELIEDMADEFDSDFGDEIAEEEAQDLEAGSGSAQYATAPEIVVGGTYSVSLTETMPIQYFRFVPAATAVYSFRSSYDGTAADPYARIFSPDGTILYDDDDSADAENLNFLLNITLNAGQTYYFQAATYSSTASYSFTVSVLEGANPADYIRHYNDLQVWQESNKYVYVCPGTTATLMMGWSNSVNQAPTFTWSYRLGSEGAFVPLTGTGNTMVVTAPAEADQELEVRCEVPNYDEDGDFTQHFYVYASNDAHELNDWVVTAAPTALAEGTQVRTCKLCGKTVESAPIAKLPAFITMNVNANSTIPLKVKQSTSKIKVTGLQTGDYVTSWTSSKPKIASVTANGKITGKKTGTAVITVATASGLTYSFKIKVQKANVATKKIVTESPKKITLKKKAKQKIGAQLLPITTLEKVSYLTSNKSVAAVKSGVIVAKNKGKAVITVKAGKKTVKIKVNVTK